MTLSVRVEVAARDVEVELDVGPGERVAVLGPNGAGKSSLLATLAGTLRPDRGRAVLDGRVLFAIRPGRQWLPPYARGVALLAQEPLLFPHLSARDNVAFGPRAAGRGRRAAYETADRWLAEVEVADLAARRPAELSGGQAQRVAIARALATEPRVLLLDEPMAALDVGAAPTVRRVLRRVLADRSVIMVTHDLLDAWLLADRVVVLDHGRVVESGPTEEVLRRPRTAFAARLAGLNIAAGTAIRRDGAGTVGWAVGASGSLQVDGRPAEGVELVDGEAVVATFSPTAVSIFIEPPGGSPRNHLRVRIAELEPRDDQVRVRATNSGSIMMTADVTPPVVAELDLHPGLEVWFVIKATAVSIYPA